MIYEAIAKDYDKLYRKNRHIAEDTALARIINAYIERLSPRSILDIGCGTGAIIARLNLSRTVYTGVDISGSMIAQARLKYPEHNFIVGNAISINVPYELIISNYGAINYIETRALHEWLNHISVDCKTNFVFSAYTDKYRPAYHDTDYGNIYKVRPEDFSHSLERHRQFSPILPGAFDELPPWVWRRLLFQNFPVISYRYQIFEGSYG